MLGEIFIKLHISAHTHTCQSTNDNCASTQIALHVSLTFQCVCEAQHTSVRLGGKQKTAVTLCVCAHRGSTAPPCMAEQLLDDPSCSE